MVNKWVYDAVLLVAIVALVAFQSPWFLANRSAIALPVAGGGFPNRTTTATEIIRASLEPPRRDPFAVSTTVARPPASAAPMAMPDQPVQAVAPPLDMSFVGRTTDPSGATKLFFLVGKTSVSIEPGQVLPNGYQVDSVTDQAVELSYPPLHTKARLELPSTPLQEIR